MYLFIYLLLLLLSLLRLLLLKPASEHARHPKSRKYHANGSEMDGDSTTARTSQRASQARPSPGAPGPYYSTYYNIIYSIV